MQANTFSEDTAVFANPHNPAGGSDIAGGDTGAREQIGAGAKSAGKYDASETAAVSMTGDDSGSLPLMLLPKFGVAAMLGSTKTATRIGLETLLGRLIP